MHRHLLPAVFSASALCFLATAQEGPERRALQLEEVVGRPSALAPVLPRAAWIGDTGNWSWTTDEEAGQFSGAMAPDGDSWLASTTSAELAAALRAADAGDVSDERFPPMRWLTTDTVRAETENGVFHWRIGEPAARRLLAAPKGAGASAIAPGDVAGAWIRDHQITVAAGPDGEALAITDDGTEDIVYGGAAHRAEFGIVDGLWWDPTGRYLAFSREDLSPIDPYPYADYDAHPPAPVHGRYPMAGRQHSVVTIGVHDRERGTTIYLAHDDEEDLYWTNVTFAPDGGTVFVALVARSQDSMTLARFDTATGARQADLFTETDAEWIEPEHGPIFVPGDSGRFVWFSPRNGYRHLYLHEGDGTLVRQITQGTHDVAEFLGFGNGDQVFYMASGHNPLEMHLWRASWTEDGPATRVTSMRGWHAAAVSADGSHALDTYRNLQQPGAVELLVTQTGARRRLAVAEDPSAAFVMPDASFFEVRTDDGTTLHGILLTPPGAREQIGRRYPVLQYVYGGPHSQLVRDTWLGGANPWLHYMASRGYVVFQLDNRGTDNRGLEFAQAIHRRLAQLEVKDQALALQQVTALPFADPDRVGIHGWSYGGYMTLHMMLQHPELYACGISGAPVTDWAQYETGYTERYMDTPEQNPDGYRAASAIERAGSLKGELMVVHGTDDKTVMWSQAMRFLSASIEAGTFPRFMAYPGAQHGLRGPHREHLYAMMTRFFDRELRP